MDIDFQDRIDEYLLHGHQMTEEAKALFLKEIEQDAEKKEQFELTRQLKAAITSREDKLKAMAGFEARYARERLSRRRMPRRALWWASGAAAVLAAGFFATHQLLTFEHAPMQPEVPGEVIRGNGDVFEPLAPAVADTTRYDSVPLHERTSRR